MDTIKTRGRPAGSVSYVEVTLGDLFVALGTEQAKVRVDKRWAEAVGVVSRQQIQIQKEAVVTNDPKPQFTVE
jgi:hypothetical protein